MKAIFIDAKNRLVQKVEGDFNDYKEINKILGCSVLTYAGQLENGDTIFVDDEGLLKPCDHFFFVKGQHQPFAGNGLILGDTDDEGNSTDAKSTLTEISTNTQFLNWLDCYIMAKGQPA